MFVLFLNFVLDGGRLLLEVSVLGLDVYGGGACASSSVVSSTLPLVPRSILPTLMALLLAILSLKVCDGRAFSFRFYFFLF